MSTPTNGHRPQLRLRLVATADFRHAEAWQLDEVIKQVGKKLGKDECAILVSKNGRVMRFIFGAIEHDFIRTDGRIMEGQKTVVVASRTYRVVSGGVFHPYMLQNYANDLGFELAHLKRLEAHLKMEGVDSAGRPVASAR